MINLADFSLRRQVDAMDSSHALRNRMSATADLHRKDLFAHWGCVNAVEFSSDGSTMASGGDDKRVLLWNMTAALQEAKLTKKPSVMKGQHDSNIFCLGLDEAKTRVYSGGNDEQVIAHDVTTGDPVDVFRHPEAVYGVDVAPGGGLVVTACSDGVVRLIDPRAVASSSLSFFRSSSASLVR